VAGGGESVELLSRAEADGEVPLGSYDGWTLAAVGAGSPLRGLVLTDEMRAMDANDFFARLALAREELGFVAAAPGVPPPNGNGDAAPQDGIVEFELPSPLNFIVAARRAPAYIGLAFVTDHDDIAPGPQLKVGWRGFERVLHGVWAEDGTIGVLDERRDPQGVHEFVLRSPATEAASLYDGFQARPNLSEHQLLSVHVFHQDPARPRHDEVRFSYEEGTPTSRSASEDGTAWTETRRGDKAQAGWIELLAGALAVPS